MSDSVTVNAEEIAKMTDAQLADLQEKFMQGQETISRALAASKEAKKRQETALEYAAFLADKEAKKQQRVIDDETDRRAENRKTIPRPNSIAEFSALPLPVRVALLQAHSSEGDNFVEQIRRKPPTMSWEVFDALVEVVKKK